MLCRNAWWRQQNIKIQPRRKVHESSIYYLCLLEKMHSCQNNLEKFYMEKKVYAFWLFMVYEWYNNKKFDSYRGKVCMKKFCKDLIQHAMKIINYEEKEMILLTYKQYKSYEKQNFCYICKKRFSTDNEKWNCAQQKVS